MNTNNLQLLNNSILINKTEGILQIFIDENSGRIMERNKFPLSIHTGIRLGIDNSGNEWLIHNHLFGRFGSFAQLVTKHEFGNGEEVRYSSESCKNSPIERIEIALEAVKNKTKYFLLTENCNHLTSNACNGKKRSKSLQTVSLIISSMAGGIAIFSKSPKTKKIAAGVAMASIGIAAYDSMR